MKEVYLGSDIDRAYIETYLENIRRLDPIEITTLSNAISLSDDHIEGIILKDQFKSVLYSCLEYIRQQYGIDLDLLSEARYYTAFPPEDATTGGFYDLRSLGYQYWYQASFVVALNSKTISPTIRTFEMVRNFLHDCLHHSTFRSYRRAMRVPANSPDVAKHRIPEVYREQYGINFRNKDGMSYSSPKLTVCSPDTINLNLLMDGVIVLVVGEALKETMLNVNCGSEFEEAIRNEIVLESFNADILPRADLYATQVMQPSKKFVEHWGRKDILPLVLLCSSVYILPI